MNENVIGRGVVLAKELESRGLGVERQVPVPILYRGLRFEEGFRADILVDDKVILELKSVEQLTKVHAKQVFTYLKLKGLKLGFLLNFGGNLMNDGIDRIVNGLPEEHLCVLASYRCSKVIHRRRGEPPCSSPQPPVNNFGGAQKMCCEKLQVLLNRHVEHAGSGRRILRPNVATFSQRLSLRHPAPCRKGTLRTLRLQVQTLTETNLYKPFHPAGPACSITNHQTLT